MFKTSIPRGCLCTANRTIFHKFGLQSSCLPSHCCILGLLPDAVDPAPPGKFRVFVEQRETERGIREIEIPAFGERHVVGAVQSSSLLASNPIARGTL